MAVGSGLAPGSLVMVLCWGVAVHLAQTLRHESWLGPNVPKSPDGRWPQHRIAKKSRDTD